MTNDSPRTRPRPVTPEMVATVCAMFPNIPPVAVQYDLQKTGSVEVTCDNILQHGSLPLPPPTVASPFAVPSTSHASSSTTSGINVSVTHQSLVDRYKLQDAVKKGIVPSEPPKTWEATPEKRQELLQRKKDAMILQARERSATLLLKHNRYDMDYFVNLKNKIKKITPNRAQPTDAEQLAKFRESWNYIESQFDNEEKKKQLPDDVKQTDIPLHLKEMVNILVDEGLRLEDVNTGLCREEFLKSKILEKLVNLATNDVPKGICGEIIRTIGSMINLLDDRFLVHNAVHQPTVSLMINLLDDRFLVHNTVHQPNVSLLQEKYEKYDEDLVDLMYIICSKIHEFPELLNIFFHDTHWLTTPQKAYPKKESENTASFSSNSSQDGNLDDGPASANSTMASTSAKTTEFTKEPEKREYKFLLFSYLLHFLHREGKSGELARCGLLFIIELKDEQLGEFILESDFATIMAAGLGALYSQLPRKLMVKSSSGGLTNATLLGFGGDNTSAELERLASNGIEVSSSRLFKNQLDSFLKLLEFCQDVLNICPNVDITLALLQNVKNIFLENILYPSILECSDTDGSAVAVISYIDIIMQTLEQEELVDVVVGFLMDSDGDDEDFWKQPIANKIAKRQSTINLFEGIDSNTKKSPPYFTAIGRFTLKDLMFSRLRSSSQQTVIATLKLLHTVISKHCRYSLKLLNIELDENATCFPRPNYLYEDSCNDTHGSSFAQPKLTTISHHLKELDLFFSLIAAIDPTPQNMEIFTNGYDSYVRDAEMIIEADPCYINGLDVEWTEDGPTRPNSKKSCRQRFLTYSQGKNGKKGASKGMSAVPKHRLNPTDRLNPGDSLLQILLGTLTNFFAHSPELNLVLTGVLSALAVCPYRSLEGWLVFSGTDRLDSRRDIRRDSHIRDFENLQTGAKNPEIPLGISNNENNAVAEGDDKPINEFDEDDDRSIDFDADKCPSATKAIGATPRWTSYPQFFTIFKTLTQQVDYYRSEIEGFDQYLKERRGGLLDADDEIDENFFKQPHNPSRTPTRRSSTSNHSGSGITTNTNTKNRKMTGHKTPKRAESNSNLNSQIGSLTFRQKETKPKEITLSTLLNNVVILEEAIKELVAIVQVRRSLGIDEVRYL
ncbi:8948_t:CDS:2 [Cetraspora pellucida]|uniref:8948_t:CDS:1 n=1 Tax=Cetraspora pellucida TaxID=1433469 RepID=A0ACA9K5N3_9GLOM|nr:8948_t:CDS:2 [Cetraspora pellucida]